MKKIAVAMLLSAAPAFLLACSVDDGSDTGGAGGGTDQPLDADIAAVRHEAQKAVDRNIRARQELADSNAELDALEIKIGAGAQDALDFVRAYRNPTTSNPPPIAPDVAEAPPASEPPVFTDVSSATVTPSDTSGGFVESGVADELTVVMPDTTTS
ncbi:MAG: hypothetical protein ACK4X1_14630 [Terricaulis sp.]